MIVIHPFSKKLHNGKRNPKNYPYWSELIALIKEPIIQVGTSEDEQLVPDFRKGLPIKELEKLIIECRTFVCIDSFFHHLAWSLHKPGIVLFGKSDPLIFGHKENTNLLASRSFLRDEQFEIWEKERYDPLVFVKPEEVIKHIQEVQNV